MSIKLVHTKLAVVSTVQSIKPNIDNAVEIANGEIRNAHLQGSQSPLPAQYGHSQSEQMMNTTAASNFEL